MILPQPHPLSNPMVSVLSEHRHQLLNHDGMTLMSLIPFRLSPFHAWTLFFSFPFASHIHHCPALLRSLPLGSISVLVQRLETFHSCLCHDHLLVALLLCASQFVAQILLFLCPQSCCHFLLIPAPVSLAGHLHILISACGLDPAPQQGSFPS